MTTARGASPASAASPAARAPGRGGLTGWPAAAVTAVVDALEPLARPERAGPMAAYLRDQFPFLGISAPVRQKAVHAVCRGLPAPGPAELRSAVKALWRLPHREYQYAGCQLLERWIGTADADFLTDPVEGLITSRSWWDTVDPMHKAAVGPLVAAHPRLTGVLRRWVASDDRWLVRSAIIHQLGYRSATDAELLFEFCALRAADREFFIAKAIGWALRTYARQAPDDVRAFVLDHPELTPLARREALKHLGPADT